MATNPYKKVTADAFEQMQLDAGVLLTEFDFADPYEEPEDSVEEPETSNEAPEENSSGVLFNEPVVPPSQE